MSNDTIKRSWQTAVSEVDDQHVYIRGYDLGALIGSVSFASATFLLIRGRLPTPGESNMMEAVLCSVLDYALGKPGTVAARFNVSGNPSMTAGIATAVLGAGEFTLSPAAGGAFILDTFRTFEQGQAPMDKCAEGIVAALRQQKGRVPGLGHPVFRFTDPRAQALKRIAQTNGVWGALCDWYEALHRAFVSQSGKAEIVINEVGMLSAILAQMGFTPDEMTGLAITSTIPGVVAHVSEELRSKVRIRGIPKEDIHTPRLRRDLGGDLAAAGWPTAAPEALG